MLKFNDQKKRQKGEELVVHHYRLRMARQALGCQ